MIRIRNSSLVYITTAVLLAMASGCPWASTPKAIGSESGHDRATKLSATASNNASTALLDAVAPEARIKVPKVLNALFHSTVLVSDSTQEKGAAGRGRSRGLSSGPDTTPPTVVIGSPSPTSTATGPVTYLVSYSGADSITLRKRDVTLTTTGTATGSITVSESGAKSRTISISNITGNGTLGISISPGTAVDAAGNIATAAGPSTTVQVENPAPTLAIGEPSDSLTNTGPVSFTVTYTNASAVSLSEQDITLNSDEGVTGSVTVTGSGTSERNVTVDNLTGIGMFNISVAAGTAGNAGGATALGAGPSASVDVLGPQPTLEPGPGFDGPTPEPPAIGTGPGSDAKAIARWDVVPYQTFDGIFQIGVVAFHINGIDRVEFSLEGGPWTAAIPVMTRNPLTDVVEYWVNLDASLLPDGPIEIRAVAYPTVGIPRVLQGDTIEFGNGEYSMCLFSNAAQSFVPNRVYVSLIGSDNNPGTEQQPLATIGRAFQLAGDGGEIILKDAGTYMAPIQQSTRIINQRWITVRASDELSSNNVIISQPTWSILRPEVARVRWVNIAFNLGYIQQYYAFSPPQAIYSVWFDRCHWYDEFGWTNREERTVNVRGVYFATETTVSDTINGFGNATLVRGGRCRRLTGDVLQNSNLVINCEVSDIEGGLIAQHTDLFQMWGDADNIILYGVTGSNILSAQSVFLTPTNSTNLSLPRKALVNAAFVDLDIENVATSDGLGGPPFSQMASKFEHVIFQNVRLFNQQFKFRTDYDPLTNNMWFEATDVVFENCGLHERTWQISQEPSVWPPGVIFNSCYTSSLSN